MSLPFYQVTAWVDSFLADMRGRGLAGNIVADSPAQRVEDEQAMWTGERYQLAFCGEPKDFRLELREIKDGIWDVVREVKDPDKFNQLVLFFITEEG